MAEAHVATVVDVAAVPESGFKIQRTWRRRQHPRMQWEHGDRSAKRVQRHVQQEQVLSAFGTGREGFEAVTELDLDAHPGPKLSRARPPLRVGEVVQERRRGASETAVRLRAVARHHAGTPWGGGGGVVVGRRGGAAVGGVGARHPDGLH